MRKFSVVPVFIGCVFLLSVEKSWAISTAISTALLTWDALTISLNGTPLLPGDLLFDPAPQFDTSTFEDQFGTGASATANTSASETDVIADSFAQADGTVDSSTAYAEAQAFGGYDFLTGQGTFSSPGSGILTISVPFELDVIVDTEFIGEQAIAFALAELQLFVVGGRDPTSDQVSLLLDRQDGAFASDRFTDILSVSIAVGPGDTLAFIGGVDTSADAFATPVPEPSSLLLLGSGLASLAFLRHRKWQLQS